MAIFSHEGVMLLQAYTSGKVFRMNCSHVVIFRASSILSRQYSVLHFYGNGSVETLWCLEATKHI